MRSALLFLLLQIPAHFASAPREAPRRNAPAEAIPNDNRTAAGRLSNGILTLNLEARDAVWRPEADAGPAIPIDAFAEVGRLALTPGPMVRVPAGTEIHASIHNTLSKPLRIWGFQDRSTTSLDSTVIAPGATQTFEFRADVPGTYFYWGRTGVRPPIIEPGVMTDALLTGAFIVDPAGTKPHKDERILMVSVFVDTVGGVGSKSDAADRVLRRELIPRERWFLATVNGRSWPHTERFSYNVGDTVRWRVINASAVPHPMHLHGFYFDVHSKGDANRDTLYVASRERKAVTEWMPAASTMTMSWTPTRPGNWIFHCHLVTHIAETLRIGSVTHASMTNGHVNHAENGMAGLIVGMRVAPKGKYTVAPENVSRRKLRVFVNEKKHVYGDESGYSYVLQEGPVPPAPDSMLVPSSTLTLREGEPTEITVINRSSTMATIHWHGIELESYYDGVGDWSGWKNVVAPSIAPGDSFAVRLTPQRAGTFIYHTHTNESQQLPSGLYGTLIVLPKNGVPDTTERVFLIGIGGPDENALPVINGTSKPSPVNLRAGVPHRFRFINISPLESHTIQLISGKDVQTWRALAKDGADLIPAQAVAMPGVLVLHPGETYDFEVMRAKPESLELRVNSPQTIRNRLAAFSKTADRTTLPRIITAIPIVVH